MKLHLMFAISGAVCAQILWEQQAFSSDSNLPMVAMDEIDFTDETTEAKSFISFPQDQISKALTTDKRPYNGVHASGLFTWTAIDGKEPGVMQFLATSPEMLRELYQQNSYVLRRQFVYVDPAFHTIAQEIEEGCRKELTLPGFDGEELSVVVKHIDKDLAGGVNTWSGHLRGKPQATVQATSAGDDDLNIGIHLDDRFVRYDRRKPGEWIINEIDIQAQIDMLSEVEQNTKALSISGILAAQ